MDKWTVCCDCITDSLDQFLRAGQFPLTPQAQCTMRSERCGRRSICWLLGDPLRLHDNHIGRSE